MKETCKTEKNTSEQSALANLLLSRLKTMHMKVLVLHGSDSEAYRLTGLATCISDAPQLDLNQSVTLPENMKVTNCMAKGPRLNMKLSLYAVDSRKYTAPPDSNNKNKLYLA